MLSFLLMSSYFLSSVLSLDPVIGAISAGNAVVLKPSEIAPASSSSLLANLLKNYLDNSAIKVIEGAVPETTALLEQMWDKILYTGNLSSINYNSMPQDPSISNRFISSCIKYVWQEICIINL